jgi:hypothetical protein
MFLSKERVVNKFVPVSTCVKISVELESSKLSCVPMNMLRTCVDKPGNFSRKAEGKPVWDSGASTEGYCCC